MYDRLALGSVKVSGPSLLRDYCWISNYVLLSAVSRNPKIFISSLAALSSSSKEHHFWVALNAAGIVSAVYPWAS